MFVQYNVSIVVWLSLFFCLHYEISVVIFEINE